MLFFVFPFVFIKFFAAMCKQLYKFFAIVMETIELNVS